MREALTRRLRCRRPTLRGALTGALHLLRAASPPALDDEAAVALVGALLAEVHVPSLVASERLLALECLSVFVVQRPAASRALGSRLLEGAIAAIDGEKEPRCLRAAFALVTQLGALFPACEPPLAAAAEELHDVVACYFPLVYTPPRSAERAPDAVTRDELAAALCSALMSTPAFAPLALPLVLGKLALPAEQTASAVTDALAALSAAADAFPPHALAAHAHPAWRALRGLILPPPPGGEADADADSPQPGQHAVAAGACLTKLLRALGRAPGGAAEALRLEALSDPFVADVTRIMLAAPQLGTQQLAHEQDTAGARAEAAAEAAASLLAAVASSSLAASAQVAAGIFPAATVAAARASPDAPPPRMALVLCARVAAAAAAAAADVASVAGEAAFCSSPPLGTHAPDALALFMRAAAAAASDADAESDGAVPLDDATAIHAVLHGASVAALGVAGLCSLLMLPHTGAGALPPDGRNAALDALAVAALRQDAPAVRAAACDALCAAAHADSEEVRTAALPRLLAAAVRDVALADAALFALRRLAVAQPRVAPPAAAALAAAVLNELPGALLAAAAPPAAPATGASALLLRHASALQEALFPACGECGDFSAAAAFAAGALTAAQTAPAVASDMTAVWSGVAGAALAATAACDAGAQAPLADAACDVLAKLRMGDCSDAVVRVAAALLRGLRPGSDAMTRVAPATLIPDLLAHAAQANAPAADAAADAAASLANKAGAAGDAGAASALDSVLLPSLRGESAADTQAAAAAALGALCRGLALRGGTRVCDAPGALLPLLASPHAHVVDAAAAAYAAPLCGESPSLSRASHAAVRILWAQRFFTAALPPLLDTLRLPPPAPRTGALLALAHVVRSAPHGPLLAAAPSLAALLPESLAAVSARGASAAPLLSSLLTTTCALLCEPAGREAAAEHAGPLLAALCALAAPMLARPTATAAPPPAAVRATALQGLLAAAELPYARTFPHRRDVLRALAAAVDDPRRSVRACAVAARTVWAALPEV